MKGLSRTQLKLIAICAMVCDHVAWGFLDFMTPLAQMMHVIGRLTIPIMCFFIAEGFRHTYYGDTFKKKALWICGITVTLVSFLAVTAILNQKWHFSHYTWEWNGVLYFLGFMIPLLLLKHYNGQKGKDIGKYFFYFFYPAHFMVLVTIKKLLAGCTIYQIYVGFHVVVLLVSLGILVRVLLAKPSRGQIGTVLFALASCIYIFGFIEEIIFDNVNSYYTATLTQYLGECMLIIGFTIFVGEMCHRDIPPVIYALESVLGVVVMWMLFTTKENHIFYTAMRVDTNGPFPRFNLEHGWGFFFFVVYMVVVCIGCLVVCALGIRQSGGADRKRMVCTACAIICPWVPNLIRYIGITGGYEIVGVGFAGAVILVGLALTKYGYFDSIALAGENALNHGKEGIMVVDTNYKITYYNKRMEEMFGRLSLKYNVYKIVRLQIYLKGKKRPLSGKGRYMRCGWRRSLRAATFRGICFGHWILRNTIIC